MSIVFNGEVLDPVPEHVLDYNEAVRIDSAIIDCVGTLTESFANLVPLIQQAKAQQIHRAFAFNTWTAYLAHRIGPALRAFDRVAAVSMLADEGLTNRAIAEVIGVDHKTVASDLEKVGNDSPPDDEAPTEPVVKIGRDGSKQQAATGRPTKESLAARTALLENPTEDNTEIAKRILVSKTTVQRVRAALEKEGLIPARYMPGTTILIVSYREAERLLIESPETGDRIISERASVSTSTVRKIRCELVTAGTIPDVPGEVRNKVSKKKRAEENRVDGLTARQLKKVAQNTIDHTSLDIELARKALEETRPCDVDYSEKNMELINQMIEDVVGIKKALAKFVKESHQKEGTTK